MGQKGNSEKRKLGRFLCTVYSHRVSLNNQKHVLIDAMCTGFCTLYFNLSVCLRAHVKVIFRIFSALHGYSMIYSNLPLLMNTKISCLSTFQTPNQFCRLYLTSPIFFNQHIIEKSYGRNK